VAINVLLGLLLIEAGYERMKQRIETEEKVEDLSKNFGAFTEAFRDFTRDFEKLKADFLQIPSFEIVEGEKNITDETVEAINGADRIIQVTDFKYPHKEDTPLYYYRALGERIRAKKSRLTYHCCFNEGIDLSNRIKAFKELKFTDPEYDRMFYYKFQDQNYFNFLIVDEDVVFIGFPMQSTDPHMQIALKIKAGNSKMARDFIRDLVSWYVNVLAEEDKLVPTKELLT
jgi:hypothetical protein